MEKQDEELMKFVQELADEEGISFADAMNIAVKALRYEIQRRKSFAGQPAATGGSGIKIS